MISVAVMAHGARARFVGPLVDAIETDDVAAHVVWDEREDRWDTGRRSLLAYREDAEHHLVIQDDSIPCRDLVAGVEAIVAAVPDNPIALYTGRVRPNEAFVSAHIAHAEQTGVAYFVTEGPWWGPGIVVPTRFIAELVAWGDENTEIANYDRRIAAFFRTKRIDCYYTVPSLVEHRDSPSLIPGRTGRGRHAFRFIGEHESALSVDWSRMPVAPASGYLAGDRKFYCFSCLKETDREVVMEHHIRLRHPELAPAS